MSLAGPFRPASEHSLLAFSASSRWIPCPGSMAYPENTEEDVDGGFFANKGTASHTLASDVLKGKFSTAHSAIGMKIKAGKDTIDVTEEFADHVQTYVDDVKRRAIGGYLMIEQRVSLEDVEGFDKTNYGTSDAVIAIEAKHHIEGPTPAYGVVEDLKSGQGEKVYCWERAKPDSPFTMTYYPPGINEAEPVEVVPNYQLMMYALASLSTFELLVGPVKFVRIVINQPPLSSLQELDVPIAVLERFALFAATAKDRAEMALGLGVKAIEEYPKQWLKPGDKQCRWCRAMARCPALRMKLQEDMGAEFDVIETKPPIVPADPKKIGKAMAAVPLVLEWAKAVVTKGRELVEAGIKVIGPDGQPYKIVEGDQGDRKWKNPILAENALTGILGPKAYKPSEILTAPAAAKLLDKRATKATWEEVFVPMIVRAPGKPVLALGSDSRPFYSEAAKADEFEEVTE